MSNFHRMPCNMNNTSKPAIVYGPTRNLCVCMSVHNIMYVCACEKICHSVFWTASFIPASLHGVATTVLLRRITLVIIIVWSKINDNNHKYYFVPLPTLIQCMYSYNNCIDIIIIILYYIVYNLVCPSQYCAFNLYWWSLYYNIIIIEILLV